MSSLFFPSSDHADRYHFRNQPIGDGGMVKGATLEVPDALTCKDRENLGMY